MLKLYNTMTRTVEEFKPITENEVKIYACGPTVYNYAHIGNLRTYVFEDVVKRWLIYRGYKINHVMNITDVGHLTSDADEGEDKMEKGAKREGKTVWEIAEHYTEAFKNDIKKLNILEPNTWAKATEHIQEMIDMIKTLEDKGFAYYSNGNVYFDTSKYPEYGKLAKLQLDDLKEGARIKVDKNKRNARDFVLWFTKSKFENQTMKWDSPWGTGYPGWHIECSAMSIKYLSEHFDIHCGGIDHITVHHPNEIAQTECATGKKWVNWWMHGAWLVMEDKTKMSKSGDGFLTLDKVLAESGATPEGVRYFLMSAHYKQELKFKWDSIKTAQKTVDKINNFVALMNNINVEGDLKVKQIVNNNLQGFETSLDNDLNMTLALPYLFKMMTEINSIKETLTITDAKYVIETLKKMNSVLAVINFNNEEIPTEIIELVKKRNLARQNKDWARSDELRDLIKEKGYSIQDDGGKTTVSKL